MSLFGLCRRGHLLRDFCLLARSIVMSAPTCSARHRTTKDLVDEGLLRVDGLLSVEEADLLKGHIENVLEQSIDAVAQHGMEYMNLFGPVLCRRHRYHVLLPLDETVLRIVRSVFDRAAGVLEVVGDDCYLCELGGLVTDPGSPAQPVHHDTTFDGSNPRVTILIALQDVTPQMGPTYLFPETNTADWHINLAERGDMFEHLLEDTPHVLGVMSAGDAIIYDTRVLHCGGANSSHLASISDRDEHPEGNADGAVAAHFDKGTRRTLLALSVQEEDGANRLGHTHIRPGYRGQFRVSDYRAWVPT